MTTPENLPPGPISENDLREQWNEQADEFNQWESLGLNEQLEWAQIRAIAADRAQQVARCGHQPAPPAEGEVTTAMLGKQLTSLATRLMDKSMPMNPEVATAVGDTWDLYEDAPKPVTQPAEGEVAKLVATLEREADAEEKRDRTAWITADELRRCAELLRQHYPDAAPAPAPSGYAYRYPDGIRFNWGQQVNGCRPSEALPYWFSPHAPEPPDVEANAIKALRRLRRWWGLSGAGYSAEIVQGITDWIDGGMVGPLPPFPPHALPLPEEEQP